MRKFPLFFLLGFSSLSLLATQDPADVKKTPAEQGYHKTTPKKKGATPPAAVDSAADKQNKARNKKDLADEKPPTYQPQYTPPGKPPLD